LALADNLETIVGIWGTGSIPTGDQDPYALRRHALGLVRILLEKKLPLDILVLLDLAQHSFAPHATISYAREALHAFLLDRLPLYLQDKGYSTTEIGAVLARAPTRLDDLAARLQAVHAFASLPEAPALAAANKRIGNILKKWVQRNDAVVPGYLQETAELELYNALQDMRPVVEIAFAQKNFQLGLCRLASLRAVVDRFFTQVMVMSDDQLLRSNRCALLAQVHALFNHTADISRLSVE
jgi:glycyl-tRNA synthetase beta chain